ncbi:meteorin [Hyperolius riggenbachi]|uniref:meteorin n=1 Tax=Hyperolius riggenbachi TaxID=752182 RepID=UPI0035A2DEE5
MLNFFLWVVFLGTLKCVLSGSLGNPCNWRGSGLSLEPRSVEHVLLHCVEGTVEWLYPRGALRLRLVPRQPMASLGPGTGRNSVCIKPAASFQGAQLYLEKDGELQLLLSENELSRRSRVLCFSWRPHQKVALFMQATLQWDISRRIAAFRYELRSDWDGQQTLPLSKLSMEGACRPCDNTEILMAVCTSDFVIRGNIRTVKNDVEMQESVIAVSATRVYRQKFTLFKPLGHSVKSLGNIKTPLSCGVRSGPGSFLFMGWVHFGDAWLGCAPRYKDFKRIYEAAMANSENPCEIALE